jgi:hypothetical protein
VIGGVKLEIDVPRLFSQLIRIRGIGVGSPRDGFTLSSIVSLPSRRRPQRSTT